MEEPDEDFVREQEQAAAAEAGRIGGGTGEEGIDPAQRPVREAGGGQAEGFEQAEEDLRDHAEYTSGEGTPRFDQFGEEAEPEQATYGEPDEERVSELTADPDEAPDDPGAGPGPASER